MLHTSTSVKKALKPLWKLGRNVARLRTGLGLSQEHLAEKADIHSRYLQKLEAGTAHPSLMVLCRLKTSLGCEWNDLLREVA
jgi:transcriptional regulator with XRE-family HTH domain